MGDHPLMQAGNGIAARFDEQEREDAMHQGGHGCGEHGGAE
jgi:hypothetical protein